jgi:uncharacterized protein (DUF2141 family)
VAAAALVLTVAAAGEAEDGRGTLRVATEGYPSSDGHALLALCSSAEDFASRDRALRYGKVKPKDGQADFVFEELPPGEYAIKVFQDEDGDQVLDVGFFGPEEAYGFSNGARGMFGPPAWEDASFHFAGGDHTVRVAVR